MPRTYPWGTKRPCVDTGYYETFNRDHVTLVDLRREPLEEIVPEGVRTRARTYEVDAIVFATGFDAMTGALNAIDIRGPRRRRAARRCGPRARARTSGSASPASRTSSSSPALEARRCSATWSFRSSSTSTGSRTPSTTCETQRPPQHRADAGGAGRLGRPRRGDRRLHAREAGELVVHGRERARQAARLHALPRRRRAVPGEVRRDRGRRLRGISIT